MQKYLVLAPAEAVGIRCTGPPNREKVWLGTRNNKRRSNTKSIAFIAPRAITIKVLHTPRAEGTGQLRVVCPRTLSMCARGRIHVRAKAAQTDVGRSPRTIDSHARVD